MPIILKAWSGILVVLTLIPLFNKKVWWIRVCDFPRLQIASLQILTLFVIIAFFGGFSWSGIFLIVALFITLIIQVYYIFPYLPVAPKEVEKSNSDHIKHKWSIMVSNVRMKNRNASKLLKVVNKIQPDFLLVVETNGWWENRIQSLEQEYRYNVKCPLENTYGMMLYSKIPLHNPDIKFLVEPDVPSIHATLKFEEFSFDISCLHPKPPAPGEAETSKKRDRELLIVAKHVKQKKVPHIVVGDLNDVAWSDTSYRFQEVSELLDPRKGRGFFNTYHAGIPMVRWALDHVFFSKEFKLLKIKRLPSVASDHFPILVELGI